MTRLATAEGPHLVDIHVGRRVCEKRVSLGFNQSDLARALGLTFQQIQKYEKGANRISASKLWDISKFFKVEIGYFFVGLTDLGEEEGRTSIRTENPPPVTRQSVEITRLAPRLSLRNQKLALELLTALAEAKPAED